jgi:polysaccharide biosynthesis/export protein
VRKLLLGRRRFTFDRLEGVMNRLSLFRISLLALLSLAVAAQGVAQKPLVERHDPAVSEYVLGPGDQISIQVLDLQEISSQPIRIDPNGYIDIPLIGRTAVGDLTIEECRKELAKRFAKYVNDPQVTVNLTDNESRNVSVIGSVNNPGVHSTKGPQRLIQAIATAGGVRSDAGSRVIITREARWGLLPLPTAVMDNKGTFSTATISLHDLMSSKSPDDNIFVDPGDVISIPKADVVYVMGTVKRAGGYPLEGKDSISLLQTLSLAQGFDHEASPSKARILRPPETGEGKVKEIPINISRIINGKDPDVQMYPNDVLYVPSSVAKITAKRSAEAALAVATGLVVYR